MLIWLVIPFFVIEFLVVDCENRIYEDIDRNSTGSNSTAGLETPDNLVSLSATAATTDSGFSSGRTSGRQKHQAPGSDDSWESGEFETFSSDEVVDDDDDSEKVHSPT